VNDFTSAVTLKRASSCVITPLLFTVSPWKWCRHHVVTQPLRCRKG